MHPDFRFWLEGTDAPEEAYAGLEQANAAVLPTERLAGLDAAYWVRPGRARPPALGAPRGRGARCSTRWPGCALPVSSLLGEGTRYAGAFRAHGLLVPVWDLPADAPAADWSRPGGGVRRPGWRRRWRRPHRWTPTSAAPAPACSAARSPCARAFGSSGATR